MRRLVIGTLLISQTLVLASILGLGLRFGDAAMHAASGVPVGIVRTAGARVAHDLRNETVRLAMHAGFFRNEVRRVASRAHRLPTIVASQVRQLAGG